MEAACIRQTDLPHTSRLFADYAYHFDNVARFYAHDPRRAESFQAAAAEIRYPDDRRAALVAALRAENTDSASLELLAKPGTVTVVTGQQVGLFSGPAYTVYKALTAVRVARDLTERGIPAVPVFWLATEDHDFAEVDHTWLFGVEHQPMRLAVPPRDGSQQPVGSIPLEAVPVEPLRAAFLGFPHGEEVAHAVECAYHHGATMGSAFRSLLQRLLGQFGLIFIDPLDRAVRKIAAPLLREALVAAPELKARILERNRELEAAGYHAQVHMEPKTSFFFLLEEGKRIGLRKQDSEYAELADRAEQVSPNALLRPVLQDYLLPTVAYVGGPAELAYMAQAKVLYDRLLGRMPVILARSGFTLLDAHSRKLIERYGLTVPGILEGEEALMEKISRALVPPSTHRTFAEVKENTSHQLDRLRGELLRFDSTLAASLDKSRSKILYQLTKIERKTAHEAMHRHERAISDAASLSGLLYPHKHLQERLYSVLPFLAKHGMDLVDRIYEHVRPECPDHQVLVV